MAIFKKNKKQDVLEDSIDPTKPLDTREETPTPVDRTDFNCEACGGQGLVSVKGDPSVFEAGKTVNKVCDSCRGTGKVN